MRRLLILLLLAAFLVGLAPVASAQPISEASGSHQEVPEVIGGDGRSPGHEQVPGHEDGGDQRQDAGPRRSIPQNEHQRLAPALSAALADPPVEENIDLPDGLTPYHDIAARLRDLQARSDRVRVEIMGQSAQGRDLYLVTVADWSRTDEARNRRLRDLMTREPVRAQRLARSLGDFRVPVFVNASIHGNEWEGTDAVLDLIERLAFDNDEATRRVLDNTVTQFNVVANPDGRVLGTRGNAEGFDLNRDFATLSQPETQAVVEYVVEHKPMVVLDLHGYLTPTLIEPAGPPHNPNYEYDLYHRWAYPQAETMAAAVTDRTGFEPVIPYRDDASGEWDDWSPIFAPTYAMYHGAYAHTVESPLPVNGSALDLPAEQRAERARTNRLVLVSAVWAALEFASENRLEMTLDQIEVFRRGAAGEPQPTPARQDEQPAEFPGAYVIPAGQGQASPLAAARLVNHLLANGVRVSRTSGAITVGGSSHPAGSYVVDMAQPRRSLANTLLEAGHDLSDRIPRAYDISGWSHALLWGATVLSVEEDLPQGVPLREVRSPVRTTGSVQDGPAAAYVLELDDPVAVQGVNRLLDLGIPLEQSTDGRVLIPPAALAEVHKLAETTGLTVAALTDLPEQRSALAAPRVAAAVADDEYFVLRELGFAVHRVSTASLIGLDLSGFDVLLVSSGLSYANLEPEARAAIQSFLDGGGGVVTRGAIGARFNQEAGVLPVTAVRDPGSANGVVRVIHAPGSPVVAGFAEHDTSFVYFPVWFTDLGEGVAVDQRLPPDDFLVAGHWIGRQDAAGQAVIVRGETGSGGRAVLFGTEPLFRDHPKKLFVQVANALYWTSAD